MRQQIMICGLAIALLVLPARPAHADGVIFSDTFTEAPSPLWGNEIGQWFAADGMYHCLLPSNLPNAHSALPIQLCDFVVEFDVNGVDDGGVWLRSAPVGSAVGRFGVLLVTDGSAQTLYWHGVTPVANVYGPKHNESLPGQFPGGNAHIRVEVSGNTYAAFVNGAAAPSTTYELGLDVFSCGEVALYSFSSQLFDNVTIIGPMPTITSAQLSSDASSTGGTLTLIGNGFQTSMSVVFQVDGQQYAAPEGSVIVDPTGTLLTAQIPPLSPGCNCGLPSITSLPTNVLLSIGQLTVSLVDALGAPLSIPIDKQTLVPSDNVQSAITIAPPGRCLVLHSDAIYAGPLTIGPAKQRITLTSDAPDNPGLTTIKGTYQGGPPPSAPTLTIDGSGPGMCISGLSFILGNSGAEVRGDTDVIFSHCKFDDNIATGSRGGGVTILAGAFPTFYSCDILVNSTTGVGGGVRVDSASARVLSSRILANTAAGSGGGLYLANTTDTFLLVDSDVEQNTSGANGGGICWTGGTLQAPARGTVLRTSLAANVCSLSGGGIFIDKFVAPTVVDNMLGSNVAPSLGGGLHVAPLNFNEFAVCGNTFVGNTAQIGGAISLLSKARCTIAANLLYCNTAEPPRPGGGEAPPHFAGGLYVFDATPAVLHNTIVENSGFGGMFDVGRPVSEYDQSGGIHGDSLGTGFIQVWHNLLVGNDGWEVYSSTPLERDGANVQTNAAFDGAGSKAAVLLYSPSTFSEAGMDNLEGLDPLFAAQPVNCALPLLDPFVAFTPSAPPLICSASDGCTRGAVETLDCARCNWITCLPTLPDDCDGSGVSDSIEVALGLLHDLDFDGVLDECAIDENLKGDLNGDDVVDGSDLGLLLGAWGGPGGDLNGDGTTDGADLGILLGAWTN